MPPIVPWIVLCAAAFALGVYGLGVLATLRHTRKQARTWAEPLPPVSILKPLRGHEESLAANLECFFAQDYPAPFEIVFATADPDDAALPVARAVAAKYPHVPVKYVRSDPGFGLNPKVANLAGAMAAASHDLCLQSDANVRARPDYLRRVVTELLAEKASLLSSLVVGVGETSIGGAMENLQLSAMIVPSVCFALHYFDVPCVIGKSMLLRRSELDELGGLESVKDVLAEDYILGREFQRAGKHVILSSNVAENVNQEIPVDRFMSRHARWLKMRSLLHVPAFVADLFANPVGLGTVACVLGFLVEGGPDLRLFAGAGALVLLKLSLDFLTMRVSRGQAFPLRYAWIPPVKDLLLFAIWPYSAISRSVEWRGTKLRLSWGTKLRPDTGNLVRRALRLATR